MRILLDECLPVDFRRDLASAGIVETARYAGLDHLSNGALLVAMAGRFDVLITVDTSLRYQNAIAGQPVAVIVLRAPTNAIVDLRPLVPTIISVLSGIQAGTVAKI
jgi:predicted nuclease of predicted toxin-antitoxin system